MMKKILFFALTGLLMASCASDEFDGNNEALNSGNGEISFSMNTPNITRATGADAATKLENKFIVYGWKTVNSTASDVFDNYSLNWEEAKKNQTETNKYGWEYVGYENEPIDPSAEKITQSVKYWDYSASQYDFVAWRILSGATAIIEGIDKNYSESGFKKTALKFQAQSGADLAKIYISNYKEMTKPTPAGTQYGQVEMTFRNLSSKVRLGIYETVPGYSVKDVEFYTENETSTGSNATIYTSPVWGTGAVRDEIPTAGNVLVKYLENGDAVAKTTLSSSTYTLELGTFTPAAAPEYKETGTFVGRTSTTATLSGSDFTPVFPNDTTELNLMVNYTLVSVDGKGETIKVTGAKATIPEQYGEWKANYAYTYLFKISDNTGGSTGGSTDPKGLYPITFDAVVTDVDNAEEGTVTSMSDPSITTYQKGVTDGAYVASTTQNIWVSANIPAKSGVNGDIVLVPGTNLKLFTAIATNGTAINEKNVANYMNNDIVLTDVTAKLAAASEIPGTETADGIAKSFTANTVAKFLPENNKAYVIEVTYDGKKFYKVITIGTPAATYTIKAFATGLTASEITTINEGESFDVYVNEGSDIAKNCVTGAAADFDDATKAAFDIVEAAPGKYTFTAKAGVTGGAKTIKVNGVDGSTSVTVKAFEFSAASVDVVANTSTSTITLNFNDAAATDVDDATNFTITGEGLSIKSVADGVVTIEATAAAPTGTGKLTYKNNGIEVASADINVKAYSFTATKKVINIGSVEAAEKSTTLTMKLGGNAITAATAVTTTAATNVLTTNPTTTDASGNVTLTAGSVAGTATVAAPDTKNIQIEVKNFTVTSGDGGATITFKDNGTAKNVTLTPSAGTLVKNATTGEYTWTGATAGATIKYTYNGQEFTLYKKS